MVFASVLQFFVNHGQHVIQLHLGTSIPELLWKPASCSAGARSHCRQVIFDVDPVLHHFFEDYVSFPEWSQTWTYLDYFSQLPMLSGIAAWRSHALQQSQHLCDPVCQVSVKYRQQLLAMPASQSRLVIMSYFWS